MNSIKSIEFCKSGSYMYPHLEFVISLCFVQIKKNQIGISGNGEKKNHHQDHLISENK